MPGTAGPPDWVEPQLATLTRDWFSDPAWIFERKLDGERCLAFGRGAEVHLLTRNKKSANAAYPELAGALARQQAGDFVVDGEVVSFDRGQTSFAHLQQRIHVAHPSAELCARVPVFYYLFDIMYAGGEDVRARPLRERKELLRRQFSFDDPLRFTAHRNTDGAEFIKQACHDGWEGLIAKRADAPYHAGRSKDWLKFKCQSGQEFVIGGYTDPQRSRVGFGALLLGYYDAGRRLVYAGKVGTGFTQQLLRDLHAELTGMQRADPPFAGGKLPRSGVHWVEPRLVAEVGFSEWTQAGELRHPRFEGLRRDKPPTDVVREVPVSTT
ncbi:MAG TPA: non-homologous end-joining DNA ligase [Streptosporangiaceae bacterium]|jgi:DNA ligase D-like protein (predicted ligase)